MNVHPRTPLARRTFAGIVLLALLVPAGASADEAAPANDAFSSAQPISLQDEVTFSLEHATRESGEPVSCGGMRRTVWYSFTATEDLDLRLTARRTASGGGDPRLAVYRGTSIDALQQVTCRWWSVELSFEIRAEPGETLWIQVGSDRDGWFAGSIHPSRLARLGGTAYDADGTPAANVCARLYHASGGWGGSAGATGPDGAYLIRSVPPGEWRIRLYQCGDASLEERWYGGGTSLEEATPVVVEEGVWLVDGLDVTLGRASRLTGTVTEPDGAPASGQCVAVYEGETMRTSTSVYQGTWAAQIPPGFYTVFFGGCGPARYEEQWNGGATSREEATPVEVVAGEATIVDAVLDPGGTLGGVVTDDGAVPERYVCVELHDAEGTFLQRAYASTLDGSFRFTRLDGDYKIKLTSCFSGYYEQYNRYLTTWYGGTGPDDATVIHAEPGQPASITVDAVAGGRVEGTILDEEGFPAYDACINLYEPDGDPVGSTSTDDGTFSFGALEAGSYLLRYAGCDDTYVRHWYPGVDSPHDATPIPVTLGQASVAGGSLTLRQAPANDDLADATIVTAAPFDDTVDTYQATIEPGEGRGCADPSHSVWYRVEPGATRMMSLSTVGSDYDTQIAAYLDTPAGPVTLACTDDWRSSPVGERMDVPSVAGFPLLVQISTPGSRGGILKFRVR